MTTISSGRFLRPSRLNPSYTRRPVSHKSAGLAAMRRPRLPHDRALNLGTCYSTSIPTCTRYFGRVEKALRSSGGNI